MAVQKITFLDKVSTIISQLPVINRIRAEDVNEIKSVVNNNADELENMITVPIGSGFDFYGTTAPENYLFADGSAISRTTYASLFEVIGTTYGNGDGSTTFNLPDKRERVSVMYKSDSTMGTTGALFDTMGAKGGEDKHQLSTQELASHTHGENAQVWMNASGNYYVGTTGANYLNTETTGRTEQATKSAGGNQAHNNLQPYLVCNYIIRVK